MTELDVVFVAHGWEYDPQRCGWRCVPPVLGHGLLAADRCFGCGLTASDDLLLDRLAGWVWPLREWETRVLLDLLADRGQVPQGGGPS